MNPRKITQRITALALLATASYLLSITGCSSASNPSPGGPDATTHDGSNGTSGSGGTAGSGGSSGAGGASGSGGSAGSGGSGGAGGDAGNDTGIPDTGACKSDSSSCNSCYTDADIAKDPLNGCSAYTKNCVPFTTTVPTHPAIP